MALSTHFSDPEYAALPREQRERVQLLITLLSAEYSNITKIGGVFDRIARITGKSRGCAKRLYYAWRNSGDWKVLCDGRSLKYAKMEDAGPRSARFRAWVQTKVESNQRSMKQAIDFIHNAFRYGGEIIPGFESWQCGRGKLPPGISETSLRKMINKAELMSIRHGYKTDRRFELPVLTTRAGLPVGSMYQFDDVWHDNLVISNSEQVRVIEFGALDVASACRIHWGHTAHEKKEDGKKQGLTQRMFVLFIAYVLRYVGFAAQGVTLQMEHGTATLPERVRDLLETSGMNISIGMGGVSGGAQAKLGGYTGSMGGNPRFKARIESSHNGLHNLLASLPGQVGKDRQNTQESTQGRERAQQQLEKWKGEMLSLGRHDLVASLENHFLTLHQFGQILIQYYQYWNSRTEHDLEGWAANTTLEYNLNGHWVTDIEKTPLLDAYLASNPSLVRERKLSPSEVWHNKRPAWARIPLALYLDIIGDEKICGKQVTVRKRLLTIQDKLISREKMYYLADIISPDGRNIQLEDNTKYNCILNPYAPQTLIVLDAKGRILGESPQYVPASLAEPEAVHAQMGRVMHATLNRRALQEARYDAASNAVAEQNARNRALAVAAGVAKPLPAPKRPATRKRKTLAKHRNEDIDAILAAPLHSRTRPTIEL